MEFGLREESYGQTDNIEAMEGGAPRPVGFQEEGHAKS